MRKFLYAWVPPWQPVAVFAAAAIVYVSLDALAGAHIAASVQAVALVALFLATPVVATICRGVASALNRFYAAVAGGVLCALAWTVLGVVSFHWGSDRRYDPSVMKIVRCAMPSIVLYASLAWLASGGVAVSAGGADARRLASARENAIGSSVSWLLVAGVLALTSYALMNFSAWWGPMSIFTGPVAGIVCVINAICDARRAPPAVRWGVWLASIGLLLCLFFMAGFVMITSGVAHY